MRAELGLEDILHQIFGIVHPLGDGEAVLVVAGRREGVAEARELIFLNGTSVR